jgi:carbon-monoxide dehydrogenase medium subunit
MKPAAFTYHRARDVAGAVGLLAELGDDAKIIAGGQSLVAMMNYRLARPAHLVDIGRIAGSTTCAATRDALRIGALTTHHAVEVAGRRAAGRLHPAARCHGLGRPPADPDPGHGRRQPGPRRRDRGVVPAGRDLLDAEIVARGPRGVRTIAAGDFFHGFYSTALGYDEMIVEVVFPRPRRTPRSPSTPTGGATSRSCPPPWISTSTWRTAEVRGGRIALGGVAPVPVRVPEAEAVLAEGGPAAPELFRRCAAAAAAAIDPPATAAAARTTAGR